MMEKMKVSYTVSSIGNIIAYGDSIFGGFVVSGYTYDDVKEKINIMIKSKINNYTKSN